MLAIALYPKVQERAQSQIDTVVGRQRSPKFSDMADLPYISAMVKETMRWRVVGPLSIPTRSIKVSCGGIFWQRVTTIPCRMTGIADI